MQDSCFDERTWHHILISIIFHTGILCAFLFSYNFSNAILNIFSLFFFLFFLDYLRLTQL